MSNVLCILTAGGSKMEKRKMRKAANGHEKVAEKREHVGVCPELIMKKE